MNRLIFSLLLVTSVAASALAFTNAFFFDTETSNNNVLSAGQIDLKIDNTSYYNGKPNPNSTWEPTDLDDHLFLNFTDIKPGDEGEDTISIHVQDNESWACVDLVLTSNDDTSCTEPENFDDPSCNDPDTDTLDGELAGNVNFVFWVDDGDNVLEATEANLHILSQGTAGSVLNSSWTLADANTNNVGGALGEGLDPSQTYYIGKAWCFGTLSLTPVPDGQGVDPTVNSGISCDGSNLNNATQTDTLTADFSFRAVQHRNNPNFTCNGVKPSPTPTPTTTPTPTPTATPEACIDDADVMLVLDRSGSISSSELASLKTAANDFVVALNPSVNGAHIGQVSFASTASLDAHLTANGATVQAAINALVRGGNTNLVQGLEFSSNELDNPGDGHDRTDVVSPDYYVVITDGNPNRPFPSVNAPALAAAEAAAIKSAGGTIYVVGVGGDVDASYLQNDIASSPAHYFGIANYTDLATALEGIVESCD